METQQQSQEEETKEIQNELNLIMPFGASDDTIIKEFLNEQSNEIPSEFINRFLYQYQRKQTFYSSIKAHDEWFKVYYPRYDSFIRAIKTELLENDDYITTPLASVGKKRTEYLVLFEALQQLEMTQNKQSRIYYRNLQTLMNKFIDNQRQIKEQQLQQQIQEKDQQIQGKDQQIQEKDQQIRALQFRNPESIYKIYNKSTQELLYVGVDLSKSQSRRYQHITERNNITQLGYQYIDVYLSTLELINIQIEFIPCTQGTAKQLEKELIQQHQPRCNVSMTDNLYYCLCNPKKPYKTKKSFEKHMQEVHQQEIINNLQQVNGNIEDADIID